MRVAVRSVVIVAVLSFAPTMVMAQASLGGVVRDASGAVLPGVTVEAASPALIEKARTVATDGAGNYKIENLRPGTYTVTFSLDGFTPLKRDGVLLAGTQATTVNAELRVGTVQETITVTGAAPTVDTQSTTRQTSFNHDVIDSVPTGRDTGSLAALVPGTVTGALGGADLGGSNPNPLVTVSVHGLSDTRVMTNGVSTATLMGGQSADMSMRNLAASEEVTIDTGAVSLDGATGGARINFIPRDGGNVFKATFFGTFSNDALQGSNFTQRVKDRHLATPNSNKRSWDINPGGGGPIVRDKLWYWVTGRSQGADSYVGGMFYNLNANNPASFSYAPDESRRAVNTGTWWDLQARVTWQATPKNKIAVSVDNQDSTQKFFGVTATVSPESAVSRYLPVQAFYNAEWTSPLTSRLLADVVVMNRQEVWGNFNPPEGFNTAALIPVVDQSTNLRYRGGGGVQFGGAYNRSSNPNWIYRASLSYVTGSHSIKFGYNDQQGYLDHRLYQFTPLAYRVNNRTDAIPNQVTEYAYPLSYRTNLDHDMGLFAQDRWTMGRATLSYGVRFDRFTASYPAQAATPGLLFPNRNTQYAAKDFIDWKDVEPRFGFVYDLMGDGKTAVRASANKYLAGLGLNGLATDGNPVNNIATSTARSWIDNGDYVVNCDLLNPAAQDSRSTGGDMCGPMANAAFLTGVQLASYSNELLTGWGNREYNWEFSTGVQRELFRGASIDVGYFRRIFGNFRVTDNVLTSASDYTLFDVTAPVDSRLPGGGGYVVHGIPNVNPDKFGQVSNLNQLDKEIGANQFRHWTGVDITLRARARGVQFTAGTSLGRQMDDNCQVVAKLPEAQSGFGSLTPREFCHVDQMLQKQFKLNGAYTLPKADILVSGAFQSLQGPQVTASVTYANAQVAPSLGRNLSGNTQVIFAGVVRPQSMYGERLNELDLRFGKVIRTQRLRITPSVDIFNALNNDTILVQSNQFATWQFAQSIVTARFFKFSVQIDY